MALARLAAPVARVARVASRHFRTRSLRQRGMAAAAAAVAGKLALVTGANSGLGKEAVLELARGGYDVVLACRSKERGEAAAAEVRAEVPGASLEVRELEREISPKWWHPLQWRLLGVLEGGTFWSICWR